MSKIVKLAMLRKNEASPCPFGLDITKGCQMAGNAIDKMAPLNIMGEDSSVEEKAQIANANNHIFRWMATGTPCKYASQILEEKNIVNCSWDENAAGEHLEGSLSGSEYFWKFFNQTGIDGLYNYPKGVVVDTVLPTPGNSPYSIEGIASDTNEDKKLIK